jgi:hypothetical protein
MDDSQVLKKLNFPAYCVKVLDNGLIALSGGGGTAKTGVENWLELGKIDYDSGFNAKFSTICNFSTNDAVMKFISFQHDSTSPSSQSPSSSSSQKPIDTYIIAAVGNSIETYKLVPTIEKSTEHNSTRSNEASRERKKSSDNSSSSSSSQHQSNVRKRQNSTSKSSENNKTSSNDVKNTIKNGFNLKASACIKSLFKITLNEMLEDSSKKEEKIEITALAVSQQQGKKVKTNSSNAIQSNDKIILFVGCSNGAIIIYNLFERKKLHEIRNAHLKEIDDLQVNLSSKNQEHIMSIGKDGKAYIWSAHNFEKIKELEFIKLSKNNLRMRHARFSTDSHLYTTYIPMVRNKNPKSYIVQWNAKTYKVEKMHAINNTIITAFQCNQDGKFICYGDYEGQIELISQNFEHLAKFKKSHSIVVTDLAFYHDSMKPYDSNKLILSLSIDRTLQCYKYLNVKSYDSFKFFAILLLIIILFCYFFTYLE